MNTRKRKKERKRREKNGYHNVVFHRILSWYESLVHSASSIIMVSSGRGGLFSSTSMVGTLSEDVDGDRSIASFKDGVDAFPPVMLLGVAGVLAAAVLDVDAVIIIIIAPSSFDLFKALLHPSLSMSQTMRVGPSENLIRPNFDDKSFSL